MISWENLLVTSEGYEFGELGKLVRTAPANLDNAVICHGEISEWADHFISAPDEEPYWDTPRQEVDWSGFVEALEIARQ